MVGLPIRSVVSGYNGVHMNKRIVYTVGIFLILVLMAGCSFELQDLPFIPTSTATLVPTPLPTATPTLLPKPPKTEGVIQTEVLEGGRTRLTDTELGFTAVFPEQWLILGFDGDVQAQMESTFPNGVPDFLVSSANAFSSVSGLRVAAMDYESSFSNVEGVNTNIIMVFKVDAGVAEEEYDAMVDEVVHFLPTQVPNSDVIYQTVENNANGIEYGKVVVSHPAETFGFPMRQVMAFMKIGGGVLTITGTAVEEDYSRLEPSFQRVVNSIEIVP